MSTQLSRYQAERSALLAQIRRRLVDDPRLCAAWLWGSLGRRQADALSDVDLWIVVEDEHMSAVAAAPPQFTAPLGEPLFVLGAPQNAPVGGAYLCTCLDAPTAPHLVDWYWQPSTSAFIPPQVQLLFDHVKLPRKDEPVQFRGRPADERLTGQPAHFIRYFWMMLLIAAKTFYRARLSEQPDLLPYLLPSFIQTRQLLGRKPILRLEEADPGRTLQEKLRYLRDLAEQMNSMMLELAGKGMDVPLAITPGALRFVNMLLEAAG